MEDSERSSEHSSPLPRGQSDGGQTLWLALGATGIVFGDTGTSPLYTYSGIFANELHATPEVDDVKGAFSMIFWVLTWTVCIKYLTVVMRIDYHGEGGILALMQVALDGRRASQRVDMSDIELLSQSQGDTPRREERRESGATRARLVTWLGMLGCAALMGDSVITPSISVLSAVDLVGPAVGRGWKVGMAIAILVCLFGLQQQGSKRIGEAAGPIMVCWFLTIAVLGIRDMLKYWDQALDVIGAIHPAALIDFWCKGRFTGVLAWRAMAGVVLSITGAEALYSDMGHFGKKPILSAWFLLVYPCLVLQYMGQSAALMHDPTIVGNPFGSTVPARARYVLIFLAMLATIQASQALISGTFTLLSQAHALGFIPRIRVVHTNLHVRGQVYIPTVNWVLMVACVAMCIFAKDSQQLAGAYGITVTSTFVVTTLLLWVVLHRKWGACAAMLLCVPMLLIDVMFWTSNLAKIFPLGWMPVLIGWGTFQLMRAKHWGDERKRALFAQQASAPVGVPSLDQVCTVEGLRRLLQRRTRRAPAACIYLTPAIGRVPQCFGKLAADSEGELPQVIMLLHVAFDDVPFAPDGGRYEFEAVDEALGLYCATVHFGWAEPPGSTRASADDGNDLMPCPGLHDIVRELARAQQERYPELSRLDVGGVPGQGLTYVLNSTRYKHRRKANKYFVQLYDFMSQFACSPVDVFGLGGCNVVEVEVTRVIG